MKRCVVLLCVVLFLTGCALGRKVSYHESVAQLSVSGDRSIAVATSDQRPYVLANDKDSDVVGLVRQKYGIPFNVSTASGKPFSDDVTRSVVSSLGRKGYRAVPVIVSFDESRERVIEQLKKTKCDRLALITLREWKSTTFVNTGLYYNVNVKIFDGKGALLAENRVQGSDHLGVGFGPMGHAKKVLPQALQRKIEELFNSGSVAKALK